MPSQAQQLVLLSEARRAIAKARTVNEVKVIRDKAEAIRMYAKAQGECLEIQNHAAEVKLRAERKAGELLKENGLGRHGGDRKSTSRVELEPIGVTAKQSHRWQRIATVPEKTFERHVERTIAAKEELTTADVLRLERSLRRQNRKAEVLSMPNRVTDLSALIGQKFGTIYADPPWQYGNQTTRAATDNHYLTMTMEALRALPIGELAADQSHLHLWTTEGFLEEGIALLKRWGFERRSGFVWVKPELGIGNYWRCSHEFMLLGVRGGLTFPPTNIKSWLEHSRNLGHSRKPEAVRQLIEKVSPGPRLELFGRRTAPGWIVWGNQVESSMFDEAEAGAA